MAYSRTCCILQEYRVSRCHIKTKNIDVNIIGKIKRGLLCDSCNHIVAIIEGNLFGKACDYLMNWKVLSE